MKKQLFAAIAIAFLLYGCGKDSLPINDGDGSGLREGTPIVIPADAINVKDYGARGDGSISDSEAVKKALAVAQGKGVYLYFPAGTYNLNQWDKPDKTAYYDASVAIDNDLKMIGDGSGKTSIVNAGNFRCKQSAYLRNMKIHSNLSIFLNIEMSSYVNLNLDDIVFYSDKPGVTRFCYAYSNFGIEDMNITNCHFSKVRYAILLGCNIKKGRIANNVFTRLGDADIRQSMGAICLGRIKSPDPGADAENILIENNKISDLYVGGRDKGGPQEEVYALPIMVYGKDVTIRSNRIENLNGAYEHEGIYVKANRVHILNNTLINAGDEEGSICAKGSNYLWVEGNTIISTTPVKPDEPDFSGIQGIMLMADHVFVKNNNIDVSWGFGIRIYVGDRKEVVVEGNTVKTKSYSGISVENLSGKVDILNNRVEVNNSKVNYYYSGIFLNKLTGQAEINVKNNTVKTENCRALSITGTIQDDYFHKAVITDNQFETAALPRESQASIQISGIHRFLFSKNTILQQPSVNYNGGSGMMMSVLFGGTTPGKQEIHDNRFVFSGNSCSTGIHVASDQLDIRNNEFEIKKEGMTSLIWWIPKTNNPDKNGSISGNIVTGNAKINHLLYMDLGNPVDLGVLSIEKNSFDLSGYIVFPVTKWSNHIIAEEIRIMDNKIGTKKTGINIIIDSAHAKDTKYTWERNEIYPEGTPPAEGNPTGIPVIRM